MMLVDLVDDLQMARQYALEQRDGPAFEGFRKQGVVGIGAGRDGDIPGLVPGNVMQVDEDTHQFGNGDAGMRIVELNGGLVGKRVDGALGAAVSLPEVLQRSGDEEILLPQAQLAPGWSRIAG